MLLFLDIETYCDQDVRKVGVYRYSEDPSFEILMCAWALGIDDEVKVAIGEDEISKIPGITDPAVTKIAHNAQFERVCFSRMFLGHSEYLPVEEWYDTMAIAGEHGYPQGLAPLARALGADPKDSAGTRLINLFCKPYRGKRVYPSDQPEKWRDFVEYCRQDVITMIDIYRRLPAGFPTTTELAVYRADQAVNDRGIRVDVTMAQRAVEAAAANAADASNEICQITGISNANSLPQMLDWLRGPGKLPIQDLRAETITKALTRKTLPPETRRVLELRQELALVASKKYTAALASVSGDGRLRGGFRFFGAHTGRWAGRGIQLHNLPRAQLESDLETNLAILDLYLGNGAPPPVLKALVRAMLVGPFTVVDYSAIEARVVSWLSGEEWVLEAFRRKRDIYVETAERMGGLTRFQGKVAVLALGYNGGTASLAAMGFEGSTEEAQVLVDKWRAANPNTVGLWKTLDKAFRLGGPVGNFLSVEVDGSDRAIRLPSGRAIVYHKCEFKWGTNRFGNRVIQMSYADPKRDGMRIGTYGGRLTENATQAVARDVLAEALVRLERSGYAVVGHVHDEILVEGRHPVDEVAAIMTKNPRWATGLPLDGEGFVTERYRKG